jgi:hypothetical protein
MTSRILTLCFGVLFAIAGVSKNQAAVVTFSGDFLVASFPSPSITITPQPFQGTWSFNFDESLVNGSGLEIFFPTMMSFSSLDPVGSTVFNSSNTLAEVVYVGGELQGILIGGVPLGLAIDNAYDDFQVAYHQNGGINTALASNANSNGVLSGSGLSGSFVTAIPEPTGFAFLLTGLVVVASRRRR